MLVLLKEGLAEESSRHIIVLIFRNICLIRFRIACQDIRNSWSIGSGTWYICRDRASRINACSFCSSYGCIRPFFELELCSSDIFWIFLIVLDVVVLIWSVNDLLYSGWAVSFVFRANTVQTIISLTFGTQIKALLLL